MSVIAEFSIPAEEFALGDLLEVRPGVRVRLESMIPTGHSLIPYFWVKSPDVDAIETALRESPLVTDVRVLDQVGDETLFRVAWSEELDGVVDAIRDSDSAILEGEGHGDHWSFRLRFPGNDELSGFYRSVTQKGISIDLEGVHNPIDQSGPPGLQLTPEQHEALAMAHERGYFSVPREITLVDLSEELGISDSAVSQRIRRGLSKVLSAGLAPE